MSGNNIPRVRRDRTFVPTPIYKKEGDWSMQGYVVDWDTSETDKTLMLEHASANVDWETFLDELVDGREILPYISSTNNNDAAAGTGARTMRIAGLDFDYKPIEEELSLNGQTSVWSELYWARINNFEVLSTGSGGVPAGKIYVGNGTNSSGVPANILTYLRSGVLTGYKNQAIQDMNATFTVPKGYYVEIHDVRFEGYIDGTVATFAHVNLEVNNFGDPTYGLSKNYKWETLDSYLVSRNEGTNLEYYLKYNRPIIIDELYDIRLQLLDVQANNHMFRGRMSGYMRKK